MRRDNWLHAGSIAFAIFIIFGALGCSNSQLVPTSEQQVVGSKQNKKSPSNNSYIPKVSMTNPPDQFAAHPLSGEISASFNMAMDPSSVSTDSFNVKNAAGALVAGSVAMGSTNHKAIFTPAEPLACGAKYVATINTEAQCDGPGNISEPLPKDFMWSFQTNSCGLGAPAAPVDIPAPFPGFVGVPVPVVPVVPDIDEEEEFDEDNGGDEDNGEDDDNEFEECFGTMVISITSPVDGQIGVPINTKVSAAFTRSMKASSFTTSTFTLSAPNSVLVSGTVTYNAATSVATFTPSVNLAPNTTYKANIEGQDAGIRDSDGNELCHDYSFSFSTGSNPSPDVIPPTVTATNPVCATVDVALNKVVSITFSEALDPISISSSSFTLQGPGVTPVTGLVTYDINTHIARFTPIDNLIPNTVYTITIAGAPNGVRDLAGNYLANNFVCSFTTGELPDITPPTVIADIPSCGSSSVVLNQIISATFSEPMNPASISSLTILLTGPGATPVAGMVAYAVNTHVVTFTPSPLLTASTAYTLTIKRFVKDVAGNFLASDFTCGFTTGTAVDNTPPTVTQTSPATCPASNIPVNQTIIVTFSEPMLASSINTSTFLVTAPGPTPVPGTVGLDVTGTIATFTPSSPLATNTVYTYTIKSGASGVKDLANNPMLSDFICSFTTAMSSAGPTTVDLGRAACFEILAMDTITNTGDTVVTGNVGLRPGSAVVGFPPGKVLSGTIHINDTAVTNAQTDLLTAYNDAAGRAGGISLPGELAGLTLAPGIYKNASAVGISGTVTLDAQGDANAVFIFQIGSTLTTGVGSQVILAGNAQPGNIFWQVGSSATLNTGSIFKGTILAKVSISTGDNTSVVGGLLAAASHADGGAVTLINTAATVPAPCVP